MAEITNYESKYITFFENEEQYNNKESSFEEVNWSAIKGNEDDIEDYYPSERETNDDDNYIMNYYKNDDLTTKFFLETVWGYFGWNWVDYDYTESDGNVITLKGGNFYNIHDMSKVYSIADGHRLQHINDFLKYAQNVEEIEYFDTSNIISAKKAFYYDNYRNVKPLILHNSNFNAVKDAEYMFRNREVISDTDLYFPNIENAQCMFQNAILSKKIYCGKNLKNAMGMFARYNNYIHINVDNSNNKPIDLFELFFVENDFPNLQSWDMFDDDNMFIFKKNNDIILNINHTNKCYAGTSRLMFSIWVEGYDITSTILNNKLIINYNLSYDSRLSQIIYGTIYMSNSYIIPFKNIYTEVNISNIDLINKEKSSDIFQYVIFNYGKYPIIKYEPYIVYEGCELNMIGEFDYTHDYTEDIKYKFINSSVINVDKVTLKNISLCKKFYFNNDLVNDNKEAQPFNYLFNDSENGYYEIVFEYSNITTLISQTIDIKSSNGLSRDIFGFVNCDNIDFTNENVVVNVHYNLISNPPHNNHHIGHISFYNCPNLKKTPKISSINDNELPENNYCGELLWFENCPELIEIDCGDFNVPPSTTYSTYNVLCVRNCPKIKYLRLGDVSGNWDFGDNTELDIPTFKETIDRQTSAGKTTLTIARVVYDALGEEYQTKLINCFTTINTIE